MPAEMHDYKNKGTLFKNDKGDNPARPDYSGMLDVNGLKYRMAAWVKESQRTGQRFLSISVTEVLPPEEKQQEMPIVDDDKKVDDDIPFSEDR